MTVILPIKAKVAGVSKTAEEISAVVYGPKFPSTPILVDKKEFTKTFKVAGESTIIELQGLSSPVEVLVKDVSFSPIKGGIVHVDFYALEMGKEITTNIPLHFINEAPVEKLGAVVSKVLHEVEVTCKPNVLPSHLDVDLATLVTLEDKIHVSDIKLPKGVVVTADGHDMVAQAEVIAEEVEPEVAPIAAADVPAEKKGKAEEEAAA